MGDKTRQPPTVGGPVIYAFVLAKDEARNIARCLEALQRSSWPIIVLDSGSTDGTREMCVVRDGVTVIDYNYVDHLRAYNEITERLVKPGDHALIVDADMIVSGALGDECQSAAKSGQNAVLMAPVEMWWEGELLRSGSLYPPKAILFAGGRKYFEACGHGERLLPGVEQRLTTHSLVHDDRKPYEAFLRAQVRYGEQLGCRALQGKLSLRDRVRILTPLMILFSPIYSLVIRRGLMSGKVGILYGLDRAIAEALVHRFARVVRLGKVDGGGGGRVGQ